MAKDTADAYNKHGSALEDLKDESMSGFSSEVVDFKFIITQELFAVMRLLIHSWSPDDLDRAASALELFEVTVDSCFTKKQRLRYNSDVEILDKQHAELIKKFKEAETPIDPFKARKRYLIQKLGIVLRWASELGLTFVKGTIDEVH